MAPGLLQLQHRVGENRTAPIFRTMPRGKRKTKRAYFRVLTFLMPMYKSSVWKSFSNGENEWELRKLLLGLVSWCREV